MYIRNLNDLLNEIKKIYGSNNSVLWFRGQADIAWELVPSVQRGNFAKDEVEQFMANDFYMRACVSMKERPVQSDCGWITLMQHYGLPTRLLDWTLSPLIALFFATNSYKEYSEQDGCIWILRPSLLNKLEGFGEYIYPMDKITVTNMLKPAFNLSMNKGKGVDKIIACYPVEYNMRVYTQQSAFTVHNTNRKLININNPDLLMKFVIPAESKQDILYELKICGITLRNVFPDVEHIAQQLKEVFE